MAVNGEDKPRTSQGEPSNRSSKYMALETMPVRSSLNKPRLTFQEGERNSSNKHFYLKKFKNDLAMSYNSTQFSSYLNSHKENYDENLSGTLKTYLNLRKERNGPIQRKFGNFIDQKKSSAINTSSQLSASRGEYNDMPQRERISLVRASQEAVNFKASNNRAQTAPTETPISRKVLGELAINNQRQSNEVKAPQQPIQAGDSPKKSAQRKTKTEIRDSFEKDISVVKNSVQLDPTRRSTQESGVIKSYAVNTNEGLIRNYNEDRVSIILNIMQSGKQSDQKWPKCSFFGVYDGHCGSVCAEFLRDNLHKFILRDKNFPANPREALREGINKAEQEFFKKCVDSNGDLIEKSGSCALVLLVVNDICFIANVGDSRAILSKDGGRQSVSLTKDHKPCCPSEKERILKAGGKVYRTQIQTISLESDKNEEVEKEEIVNGPYRVFPGRLSVSRTFGDFEAKMTKYGGNPKVVVVDPEISEVPIDSSSDFLLLGCDGVFDKFTSDDLINRIWETTSAKPFKGNYHEVAADVVERVFQDTFQRKAWDNITVILICFKNMFDSLLKMKTRLYQSERDPKLVLHNYDIINNN